MPIESLKFTNLGPFDEATFEFDPSVNVLVGPNNSGKTTALLAIAEALISPFDFPKKLLKKRSRIAIGCRFADGKTTIHQGPLPITAGESKEWNRAEIKLLLTTQEALGFCAYVPAIRFNTNYRSKGPSLSFEEAMKLPMRQMPLPGIEVSVQRIDYENPVSMLRDDRIVHDIINLDYRAYREHNAFIRKVIERIASVASQITEGFPITFAGVEEEENGYFLAFETPDGRVPLNVLSQGTQSLIQWLGRLVVGYARHYEFAGDYDQRPGVLIIDEIDAHLHPSWQRRILPALSKAFPKLQIFCSTHSPLMLAGLNAGQIHLLRRESKGRISISKNEADVHGWSADEILSHFLGLSSTTDLGTESDLQRLRSLRGKVKLTPEESAELEQLRTKVQTALQNGPLASITKSIHTAPRDETSNPEGYPRKITLTEARPASRRRKTSAKTG